MSINLLYIGFIYKKIVVCKVWEGGGPPPPPTHQMDGENKAITTKKKKKKKNYKIRASEEKFLDIYT